MWRQTLHLPRLHPLKGMYMPSIQPPPLPPTYNALTDIFYALCAGTLVQLSLLLYCNRRC